MTCKCTKLDLEIKHEYEVGNINETNVVKPPSKDNQSKASKFRSVGANRVN